MKTKSFYKKIGKKGGKVTSKKKARAARKNGKKGGRPTINKQVRLRGQQTGTKPHKGGFKRKKA